MGKDILRPKEYHSSHSSSFDVDHLHSMLLDALCSTFGMHARERISPAVGMKLLDEYVSPRWLVSVIRFNAYATKKERRLCLCRLLLVKEHKWNSAALAGVVRYCEYVNFAMAICIFNRLDMCSSYCFVREAWHTMTRFATLCLLYRITGDKKRQILRRYKSTGGTRTYTCMPNFKGGACHIGRIYRKETVYANPNEADPIVNDSVLIRSFCHAWGGAAFIRPDNPPIRFLRSAVSKFRVPRFAKY